MVYSSKNDEEKNKRTNQTEQLIFITSQNLLKICTEKVFFYLYSVSLSLYKSIHLYTIYSLSIEWFFICKISCLFLHRHEKTDCINQLYGIIIDASDAIDAILGHWFRLITS